MTGLIDRWGFNFSAHISLNPAADVVSVTTTASKIGVPFEATGNKTKPYDATTQGHTWFEHILTF